MDNVDCCILPCLYDMCLCIALKHVERKWFHKRKRKERKRKKGKVEGKKFYRIHGPSVAPMDSGLIISVDVYRTTNMHH